jgi:gas vesicle protein
MKSFLAGLGIGIGIGLIFAPMTGEETRGHLQRRANKAADAARDLVEQGRERVRSTVSAIRGKATSGEATGTETT